MINTLYWTYCHAYQYNRRQFKLIITLQALFCLWTVSSAQNVQISRAIPIFDVTTPNGNIDRAAINSVLDQVGDRPIKVISINGPSRSGKSFLLSYFIRRFESQSGDVEGRLSAFEWRGGHEGVTVGINLWSQPYFVKTEVGEIAVLLLDTQGLFDKKTTYRQNAIIFTISSLLSSLFMYNQKDVVLENTLQNINCFSNLAHNIADEVKISKSAESLGLPSSLMFLLRDFDMAEYKYGLHTSTRKPESSLSNYIVDIFSPNSGGASSIRQTVNPEENLRVRSKLQKLYFDITAFIMPHPGSDFLLDVGKNKPCNAFQVQAQSLIQSSISTKTLLHSKLDFSKILDSIEHVCSNSVKYFLNARSMEELRGINENMNALSKARALYEAHLNSFLASHPDGADDAELAQVSKIALVLVQNEFEHLEKYSTEFDAQFARERSAMLDSVLSSAKIVNAKNRELKMKMDRVKAEAKEALRQEKEQSFLREQAYIGELDRGDESNGILSRISKYLTYGGAAVATAGLLVPGPGTALTVTGVASTVAGILANAFNQYF